MKNVLTHTLVSGLLALAIAADASAATTAAGPYYATPSWDQQLPASIRFVVLSNWVDATSRRAARRCWTARRGWCGSARPALRPRSG